VHGFVVIPIGGTMPNNPRAPGDDHNPKGSSQNASRGGGARAPMRSHAQGVDRFVTMGRRLPGQIQVQLRAHPATALAVAGGTGFLLGAILGSRLGRLALSAIVPFAIRRVLEGSVGDDIERGLKNFFAARQVEEA
jgi:hypothetical protein